jgi:Flp pilus assembly protein TadG
MRTRLNFIHSRHAQKRAKRKTFGQSIVEFAVLLPLLIMMLSGLIEFGFMLNYYLDIIDAAREAARFAASDDPIHKDSDGTYLDPNPGFYNRAQTITLQSLTIGSGGQITLNPATDDIVISAFSVLAGVVDKRFPVGPGEVAYYNNKTSELDVTTDINPALDAAAPNTGMVSVEIFYDYHMVLGLPWIRAFVPDPVTLYAYSIMPNVYVEPTPTPIP